MGYYEGERDRPCPRCGSVVATLFISVSPMSFSQRCCGCGARDFTPDEEAALGSNVPPCPRDERVSAGSGYPDLE